MRDGDDNDDGFPNEISKGKIIPSGITPENIGPADYALKEGVPALMDSGSLALEEEDSSRRRFLIGTAITALGAGVGAVIGSWVIANRVQGVEGRKDETPRRQPEPDQEQKLWIAGARALADAKLDELVAHYEPLLIVIELYGGDETLWRGARRLATYALLKRDKKSVAIGRRLLQTLDFRKPPTELRLLVPQLHELVRRGER